MVCMYSRVNLCFFVLGVILCVMLRRKGDLSKTSRLYMPYHDVYVLTPYKVQAFNYDLHLS